jgi:hypothetical protein
MELSHRPEDDPLIGAEIMFGPTLIGHVEGVICDPVSSRVRRLITAYGPTRRRVAVPMEWVVQRTPTRLVIGVGSLSLDDLSDQPQASYVRMAKE